MHICMNRVHTRKRARPIARACIFPWTIVAYKLPNFLAKEGREKKKIMKKGERRRERDELKGIEKKENRKKEEALVVSIEYPANTFGTRSTNLYGMKHRMRRGYWTVDELETFF